MLCILSSARKQEETKARRERAEGRGRMNVVKLVCVLKFSFCKKRTTEEKEERIRGCMQ